MRMLRFIITAFLMGAAGLAAAQTGCTLPPLPWGEDFDTYGSASLPPCWYATKNYDLGPAPRLDTAQHHSGTASLMLYSGTLAGSHYSMAIAPEAQEALGDGVFLRFRFLAPSTSVALEVGICNDTLRQTRNFVPLDTLHAAQSGQWEEVLIDLAAYNGSGRRVAFRLQRALQVEACSCFVDDLRLESCGITQPTIFHLGHDRLTVDWQRHGAGAVALEWDGQRMDGTVPPVTLTGLLPLTDYTLRVGCNGGTAQELSVRTLPGPELATEYYEPFGQGTLPSHWLTPLPCHPVVEQNALTFRPADTDGCLAVMPLLADSLDLADLSMVLRVKGAVGTRLVVGTMVYGTEAESFEAIDTLEGDGQWHREVLPLATYNGAGRYLALRAMGSGTLQVDYVRVAHCLIDNLRLFDLTDEGVTVAWDTLWLSGDATVAVEYGSPGFAPGSGTTLAATTNPFVLTGLTPSTAYDLVVTPSCGDSPSPLARQSVTTFAHVVEVPHCMNFEGVATLPQGWVCGQGSAATTTTHYEGSRGLHLNARSVVTLPRITYADSVVLEFYGSGTGTFEVGYMDTPYSPFEPAATFSGGSGWRRHLALLSLPQGRLLALRSTSAWNIDAVAIHRDAVTQAAATAIGQTSATLAWQTLRGDSVEVEYKAVASATADFADGSGIRSAGLTTLALDNLAPATHYAIHLNPLGDDGTCLHQTLHIQTAAAATAVPYCENFDQVSDLPPSWRRLSDMGPFYPIVSSERNHSPGKALQFSATASQHTVALLPDLSSESGHLSLAFWTNVTLRPEGAMLLVGHMDNIADMGSFVATDTLRFDRTDVWRHHLVFLDSLHQGVALMLVGGGSGETRLFLDDLCVEPCVAYNVTVRNADSTTIQTLWQSHGVAAMDIRVSGEGFSVRDTFYSSPALIGGLTPNSTLLVRLNALCLCGDNGGVYHNVFGPSGSVATDQSLSISINTFPTAIVPPYCNDFESQATGRYPYNWTVAYGHSAVSDRNFFRGNHSLMVQDSSLIVLPPVEHPENLVLSFEAYASNEVSLGADALVVGVMGNRDSTSTFVPVDTLLLATIGEWQRLTADLASYAGSGHFVALKVKATADGSFFIDDLSLAPCALVQASVSEQGLVEWQPLHSPSRTAIEYGPQGFVPGSGQTDTTAASSYQLQGIDPSESYDILLTPLCDNVASCLPVVVTLGGQSSVPYCEQFETVPLAGMPSGWTLGRTYNGTPSIAPGDNQSLLLKGHSSAANRSMAVLPLLPAPDTLQVSLSLKASAAHGRLAIGHIATNADPNTFIATDTLAPSVAGQWQRQAAVVALPSQRRLALLAFSTINSEASLWVDSLAATHAVSPTLAPLSARSVAIEAMHGLVEYGPAGFDQGSGTLLLVDSLHHTVDGLTPEDEYWFFSREDSLDATCLPPVRVRMPAEAALPFCQGSDTFALKQLPEMAIDSLRLLNLYLSLDGPCRVALGVMERSADWDTFLALDTVTIPANIRRSVRLSLQAYSGSGRFIGLRSLDGNARQHSLLATATPLVEAIPLESNRMLLVGNGTVEYGPEGFTPGSGTTVSVADSLLLTLADATLYDFYPLLPVTNTPCYAPLRWHTTFRTPLPYCADLADALPTGWTPFGNGPGIPTVAVADSVLAMAVRPNQYVGVLLPATDETEVVVDLDANLSGTSVAIVAGLDTVNLAPGQWHTLRLRIAHNGRPLLAATGNGTVRLRHISVSACALPRQLAIGQPGGGNVTLDWDATDADAPFFVRCTLAGGSDTTTVRATTPPLTLQLLPDTSYLLHLLCDSLAHPCRPPLAIATLSTPLMLPYCTSFATSGAIPAEWYVQTSGSRRFLVMPQFDIESLQSLNILCLMQLQNIGQSVTLGTMTDAGNPATFDSLAAFTADASGNRRLFHSLASYHGNGRFLALRLDGDGWLRIDHLSVDSCAAFHFAMAETETDHVVLQWDQQGTPTVSVEYVPIGFERGSGIVATATASPLRIDSLAPLTDYAFLVSYACDPSSCRLAPVDTFLTFTPKGGTGCIDYTDLHASYVSCKYGSYSNPYENTGVVDKGYLSPLSRHTVHFDTTERDARTGGLLRTVPPDGQASVRLGNWTASGLSGDPQAEIITYALSVDTTQFNLLLLRYAAVLQDPEHSPDLQPRFRLQLLNENNELIDSCSMADFIANPSLVGNSTAGRNQWHQAANEVLWKDWTTVGLDLSPYGGQTILIRLTTNDCGEGSHFGYAYFTLECASKRMSSEGCSTVPDNRFSVPSGFNYRWYSNLDTTATLSDSSSIWVSSDNSKVYFCTLSFVDNPSCHFTMSAFAGARYPLAIIDSAITATDCQYDLRLTNRSTISGDGIHPVGTGEGCETGRWLLPDGSVSTASSLSFHFADTGRFDIALVAGIANDQCVDTLRRTIHIARPHPAASLKARDHRCDNESPDTIDVLHAMSFAWADGTSGAMLLTPSADTTLRCFTVDSNGCPDTLSHTLHVFPSYDLLTMDSICNTTPSYLWNDTLLLLDSTQASLALTRHLTTHDLCDSTIHLQLTLMPSFQILHHDTICHDTSLPFFDTLLATTGHYLHSATTDFGCDSMVTMHLVVVPRDYATDSIVRCDSLRWLDQRLYLADTTGPQHTLLTPRGCDSVVTLALTIHNSTLHLAQDTFCQGTVYRFEGHDYDLGGHYADTFATTYGCDSVMAIDLVRLDTPRIDIVHDYDCDSLAHHVEAHASVPFLLWSANPVDSLLDLHPHDSLLTLAPPVATTYTLYADYAENPRCPATATLTLEPPHKPRAQMRVIPESLVWPQKTYDAYDVSSDNIHRTWYVNGQLQGETSRHLAGYAEDNDTIISIALVLDDGHCTDTALALVPVLRSVLALTNAFTPGRDDNNTFALEGLGILQAEIHIYNRNGFLVFHTSDYHQPWDGRNLNGDPCPMGSYVWHIRYEDVTRPGAFHETTGTVLLIR